MLLAGDIGGTKTLLGLFDRAPRRPRSIVTRSFKTLEFDDLSSILTEFTRELRLGRGDVAGACFGVAGPVIDGTATLTNVPWTLDARRLASAVAVDRVDLLNDVQAMAYGLPVLDEAEVLVLQEGPASGAGDIALIAAGTGLGVAMLRKVDGRYVASASEAGHADFAARTGRDIRLLEWLTARYGHAPVEGVVSGRGLLNIHQVTHHEPCRVVADLERPEAAAEITAAGLHRTCACCAETLDLFVEAYGAEAGNLALRTISTGGVFVGGGIAPKILPALTDGRFMRAFRAKAAFEGLLSAMPVKVVLNPDAALLGAAVHAQEIG